MPICLRDQIRLQDELLQIINYIDQRRRQLQAMLSLMRTYHTISATVANQDL